MIAIIPARIGSKGVIKKNIKMLNGKPLIAYSIEAALNSKGISRVIVTTDSEEIASIAREYNAEVPILRPPELSSDSSKARDVYLHMIDFLNGEQQSKITSFMVLLPTCPFTKNKDIESALDIFIKENADSVISMKKSEHPISWYKELDRNGRIRAPDNTKEIFISNRQEGKGYYLPNGAIFIFTAELLRANATYYYENSYPYIMPANRSIDIDTPLDFEFADFLMKKNALEFQ